MAWMIGIDEAGYGPNLGPLVVAATTWKIDTRRDSADQPSRDLEKTGKPSTPAAIAPISAEAADSTATCSKFIAQVVATDSG